MPPEGTISLSQLVDYVVDLTKSYEATPETYVSTESMLPDKMGITLASSLPQTGSINKYQPDDILISNIRPYFKKIWKADRYGTCSLDVLVLRAQNKKLSNYVFAALSEDKFFDYVMAGAIGTKMPRGNKKQIISYPLPKFSNQEMWQIGNFVFNLNAKIALNKAINDNLGGACSAA